MWLGRLAWVALLLVQDAPDPRRLLPLEARNEWTYDSKDEGRSTLRVVRKKAYKGDSYWIVELKAKTFKETKHLKVDETGIKQHFYELATSERVLQIPADEPVYELVFPPQKDRAWELRLLDGKVKVRRMNKILEEAKIEVPAGAFQCVGVELTVTRDDKPTERTVTWFAADVGIVRMVRERIGDSGKATSTVTFDLKEHKVKIPEAPEAEAPPDPKALEEETRRLLRKAYDVAVEKQDSETSQLIANYMKAVLAEKVDPIDKPAEGADMSADVRKAVEAVEKGLGRPTQALAASTKEIETSIRGVFLANLSKHITAIKRFNFYRKAAALGPVTWDWSIARGAMLHARYLGNTGYANAREAMDLHAEDSKSPYYTPEGAKAGPASVVAAWELDKSVDEWMVTFYHRVLMLKPHLKRVGTGMWAEGIDLTTPSLIETSTGVEGPAGAEPVAYPGPGQKDVEPKFTRMGELPRPMPGEDERNFGNPITLTFFEGGAPTKVSAKLFLGAADVDCFVSSADKPSNPKAPYPNTICLMPKAALQSKKLYTVKVSCERGGKPVTKEWTFTTK